jgi:DMSO/TMAO reductase YedYZ molybdopterin-dependent catalytic subunit
VSGAALAGLSLGVGRDALLAQAQTPAPAAQAPFPDRLVDATVRASASLPLNPDGSAPEHPASAAGPITQPYMWRYTNRKPPQIEYDYRKLTIKFDARGLAKRTGTLTFEDLEKLPRVSMVTLLQCGNTDPHGIVKWTGVRFSDLATMLGVAPFSQYVRLIGSDRFYVDEDMETMMHRQVLLAWMMNDQPLTPEHGAPIRLVVPFRFGARSIKAVTDILLGWTGMPTSRLPGA